MRRAILATFLIAFVLAPLVSAQRSLENVTRHGNWVAGEQRDPIDDSITVVARTEAENGDLMLVCRPNGRLELLVVFDHEYVDGDTGPLILRVDRNEPARMDARMTYTGSWSRATVPQPGLSLIEQMKQGGEVVARAYNASDLPADLFFSLSGFTAATGTVLEQCAVEAEPDGTLERRMGLTGPVDTEFGNPIGDSPGRLKEGTAILWSAPRGEIVGEVVGPLDVTLKRRDGNHYLVEFEEGIVAWVYRLDLVGR